MRLPLLVPIVLLASGCAATAKRDAAQVEFLQKRIASLESAGLPQEKKAQRLLSGISLLPDATLAECGLYRVQRSDTLAVIARKHGVSVRDLAVWNVITDPARVRAGDILIITDQPPNKAPEPTPTSVMPRANEGESK